MISLYFHIPFCQKKCPYCHFFVVPMQDQSHAAFQQALLKEWELRLPLIQKHEITSLYFGGGTPSLAPGVIETLLERAALLKLSPNCEITVEANPEQITSELIRRFKTMGVNRLSVGIQSLDEELLKVLGRGHTAEEGIKAVETIAQEGIENITIDLMDELPHQTLESWENTLDRATQLPITHLSLYNLTFEKNTVFTKNEKKLRPHLPPIETCTQMLEMACSKLEASGLKRYEISAFAKEGYEAIHNTGYWTGRPFLGFGPSAFSFWDGKRFQNVCHLKRYSEILNQGKVPVGFEECLPYPANLHEQLAVHLRLHRGVNLRTFPLPSTAKPILEKLQNEGFILQNDHQICLTEKGRLFYDSVAEEIIL
ncbi:MAG: radical SAM family heme chaperone HemW [Simkania sp.]|nr:radical SAM family heme chaperone HemW [Simkania sp.]MCP5490517.1 radical SAM family heme chaperone HemW [Chlamydiales bacterium]